ncbi:MAG: GHKL domain-containing protein [Clostridia bacterium]|nr:GHKL domain-containing protein [Clostridia bacterium]
MYSPFAYSIQMQIILAVITFIETFCSMYILSNILLAALGLSAKRKQKLLYAFVTGTLLQNALTYSLYLFGEGAAFTPAVLLFVVTPNPIRGLLFYFAAQKIFRLTPVRSIKLATYIFLFWVAAKTLSRIIGSIFFVQDETSYNFMKDAFQQVTYFFAFFVISQLIMRNIRRGRIDLSFVNKLFFDKKKEFFVFFLSATFAFVVRYFLPLLLIEQMIAFVLSLAILLLFIAINVCLDLMTNYRQTIANHQLHISALFKGLEDLRGIKHDFNNILNTYSGYLELKEYDRLKRYHASMVSATSQAGDVGELAQRMHENPAILTLLINKKEYAEKMNVKLILSLKCKMDNFYIDDVDLSRILSCLLDNANEAASDSGRRRVFVTMEPKTTNSKLIIIANSTASTIDPSAIINVGVTTKDGHDGIGLTIVHNTIGKYGNAVFHMGYCNYEFSSYLELKEMA